MVDPGIDVDPGRVAGHWVGPVWARERDVKGGEIIGKIVFLRKALWSVHLRAVWVNPNHVLVAGGDGPLVLV